MTEGSSSCGGGEGGGDERVPIHETSLQGSLKKVNSIPPLVIQMIQNGEKSGKLEEMLSKLSDYLENRFKNSTKIAMNLLEPLVIIILGLFVALIVLAILMPLIQLNTFTTML